MPKLRTRLRIRRLDTIGFVDKGDDPKAEIVFFKRAETFDEVGSQEKINVEIWDLTHRIGRSIMSALEDAEDDQSPIDIINTSIDQFSATVRARAPMWAQGKPVVEKKIIERGQKFLVMSEDGTRVLGTHDTKEEAETQLRAVEANTNKGLSVMKRIMKALRAFGLRTDVAEDEIEKLLAESAPGSDDKKGTDTGGEMPFDIEKLGDEDRAEFEKLQGQLADATAKVAELEKGADGADDELNIDDLSEPVAKALQELEKRTKVAEERAQAAEESVSKLTDARDTAKYIQLAKTIGLVPDDDAATLRKIAGALEPEDFDKFTAKITSLSKQATEGGLYGEIGAGGEMAGDEAEAEFVTLTKKYQEDNPGVSEELARGTVLKNKPTLRRALERSQATYNTED